MWGKGKEDAGTGNLSIHTAYIHAGKAFRVYAGHIDQTGIGQSEHGSRWTARYALLQVGQDYLRAEWSVRHFEVGDSGGGADLIGFLACCTPLCHVIEVADDVVFEVEAAGGRRYA